MFRGGIGMPEILLILAVVVLLFGASKLPELARGSGRALRIFKAETKGLLDDDEDEKSPQKDESHSAVLNPTSVQTSDEVKRQQSQ